MGRSQLARSLHMALQIPVPAQAHPAHIDNIRAQRNGRAARKLAIRQLRAQRLRKARQVLIEGAQIRHLAGRAGRHLLDLGDGLGVQVADLKQIHGDAAAVAPARPLRVEAARGLVGVDVDGGVELVEGEVGAPGLGGGELGVGGGGVPAPGAEVAQEGGVIVGRRRRRGVEVVLGEEGLEGCEGGELGGGEVAEVAVRVAVLEGAGDGGGARGRGAREGFGESAGDEGWAGVVGGGGGGHGEQKGWRHRAWDRVGG